MTDASTLRRQVAEDVDHNGDMIRKRDEYRAKQDTEAAPIRVKLVSTHWTRVTEEKCDKCGREKESNRRCVPCLRDEYDEFNVAHGARHPNSIRFHELLSELGELHDLKQADYGRGDDPFANVRASEEWGVPGWVGAMVRAGDKIRRLQALRRNGRLENESAEDSLRDLAVYTVIALVLFEQAQNTL